MTKISKIGGEFALIARVTKPVKDKNVIIGIGDDTAVLKYTQYKYLLWTVDMLVEGDHFNLKWSTPEKIGKKAMEVNVSDIGAMGGLPKYALISICIRRDTPVEFVDKLYKGMYQVAKKYDFEIIGGDTTHGDLIVIDVSMIGEVRKNELASRSNAKPGQLILTTGNLGASTAGLNLLRQKKKGISIKKHLEPKARLKEAQKLIKKGVNCMIDVSDGLASEVKHICEMSKTGAVIYKEKIPLAASTKRDAKKVNKDPQDYALNGGEDFELVFTINKKDLRKFKDSKLVGKILPKKKGIYLLDKGEKKELGHGFIHF